MYTYLHNSRCSKSRTWLKNMEKSWKKYELREYLKNPLDLWELIELHEKLKLKAIKFTRTKEAEFKEANLTKDSSDMQILKAMVRFPKLMERAIIFDENRAFVCRPAEEILRIFKK